MVVAVDGTEPARVAGRRLRRLLRGALVGIGLSGLVWLLGVLIGSGTAAADTNPAAPPSQSTGLLGGLVGGLTGTLGGVVDTATSTVGQLAGGVLDTATSVVQPAASPAPAVPESPQPQPEPVSTKPAAARTAAPASVPVTKPARPRAAPAAVAAAPVQPRPAAAPAPIAVAVPRPIETVGDERADRSGEVPIPGKAPSAPPAPAVPTGGVSAGHDGPGQARTGHGVLTGQTTLEPPAGAFRTNGHPADAADTTIGLPPASPD